MMAALFFIIAELLIFERKTTLTRNINLFDRKLK
jgi:hypothetical protein